MAVPSWRSGPRMLRSTVDVTVLTRKETSKQRPRSFIVKLTNWMVVRHIRRIHLI